MPDLNVSLSYFNHRKTKRLVAALGRDADVLPIRLWAYVGDAHPETGELIGYATAEIESFMGWRGVSGRAIEALIATGWLDEIQGGYKVHDWAEHQGHLAAYKVRGRVAALKRWAKARGECSKDAASNATSIPQEMLGRCSDGLTDGTDGNKTPKEPPQSFAVEPPPGMPEDEERAGFIGERAGVPKEKAISYWHELASRGWKDGRGQSVFNFGSHCKVRWGYDRNKTEQTKLTAPKQRTASSHDLRNVIQAKKEMAQQIKNRHCAEVAAGEVWSDKAKRSEYFALKREIETLTKQMANLL